MKICTSCGSEKPEEEFRPQSGRTDRRGECRQCESNKRTERLKRTPESRMAAIEAYRRYHEKKPAKARPRDHKAEYQKHKAKKLVRAETKRLIAAGGLHKSDRCAECGDSETEVHHLSYDRADNIVWLCRKCHILQHRMTLKEVCEFAAIRSTDTRG